MTTNIHLHRLNRRISSLFSYLWISDDIAELHRRLDRLEGNQVEARLVLQCSFCSKTNDELRGIVKGDHACICSECVSKCVDICINGGVTPAGPAHT